MDKSTDIAPETPSSPQSKDFAYNSIEEYESLVGFKVNEAFRMGWEMGRLSLSENKE